MLLPFFMLLLGNSELGAEDCCCEFPCTVPAGHSFPYGCELKNKRTNLNALERNFVKGFLLRCLVMLQMICTLHLSLLLMTISKSPFYIVFVQVNEHLNKFAPKKHTHASHFKDPFNALCFHRT